MTVDEAIKCIDDVLTSEFNYDDSLEYKLTSYDFDWLYAARKSLEDNRWIPVTERLPKRDDRVLVYIPEIGGANCSIQISKGWSMKYVSHWMTLPEPPEDC